MLELKIQQIENGYIVSYKEKWEKGDIRNVKTVIEDNDDEKDTMKRLLEFISEHFGILDDKWRKDNLRISFDGKGRKVE